MNPTAPHLPSLLPEVRELVFQKIDYKSIAKLLRTSQEMRLLLEERNRNLPVIPKEDGHLFIRQRADPFVFMAKDFSQQRTLTVDAMTIFTFEMISFVHISPQFFQAQVRQHLMIVAEKCKVLRLRSRLDNQLLQEIITITRPVRVEICQQLLDAEEPVFQGIRELAISCGAANSPYLDGHKMIRLLGFQQLLEMELIQATRTPAIIAVLKEWLRGADVDQGRGLIFVEPLFFFGREEERRRIIFDVTGHVVDEELIRKEILPVVFFRRTGTTSMTLNLTFEGSLISIGFQ